MHFTLSSPLIVSTWCEGNASTFTLLTIATVLCVLSFWANFSLNKPLNLAIRSSAKSILGPVTMQTLELAVYLEKQHQAIYLSKNVVTPIPRDFFIQICLWFCSDSYVYGTYQNKRKTIGKLFVPTILETISQKI